MLTVIIQWIYFPRETAHLRWDFILFVFLIPTAWSELVDLIYGLCFEVTGFLLLCFMNWREDQHKHGGSICLYVANVQVSTSRLDIVKLCSAHRPEYHHNHIHSWSFPMGTTPSINVVTHTFVLEAVSCSCLFSEHPITKVWRCSLEGVLPKLPFFCVVPLLWSWNVLFWHGIFQYSK